MIKKIIEHLKKNTQKFSPPLIDLIIHEEAPSSKEKKSFLILIGCLLSLRAKDSCTIHVCRNLFKKATTPQELLSIPLRDLEKIIFEIGLYKNKAKVLHHVSKTIIEKYNGKVPKTRTELLSIKGVGRKTANLVLGLAFDIPAICVDIHVHRISNRLGIVKTKNPQETELALEKIIPKKSWIEWNKLLVMWGQNICLPRTPKCKECAIKNQGTTFHVCDYYTKKQALKKEGLNQLKK